MVISADEKKVLLARLEKARETKAAKAAATKAAKKETLADVKEPEPPAPAPAPAPAPVVAPPPVPEPAPIVPPPPSEPIDIPAVPDLVAASKKKPAKKTKKVESSDDDSDSDDEPVLPPKMKGAKKQAYMKIKIYKEPKNTAAFQSLIEAVQDEQQEEPEVATPPPSSSIGRSCRFANANTNNNSMKKGAGVVSAQELMRRAAMEFFS